MKKLLLPIITLALAVSCQEAELTPIIDVDDYCLYGTMESMNETKTSMDEHNNILWSEGDQLVAFMKTTLGRKYQIKEEYVGSTTGGFSRVAEESSGDDLESGNELSHNVVLYPYASTSCMKNDDNETANSYKVNLNLPETQTYAAGSFGNGSFPMIAVSSSNELLFKNICGGIKLKFKGEDKIKSIKLESIGGEKISGKATVIGYADETVPTTIMVEGGVSSVTLDCGDGVQLSDEPTTFIISVPPVEFESGMKITVTDTDGISRKLTNTSKNTVKRSTLLTFPVITYTQTGVFELAEGTLTTYEVKAEGGTVKIPVVTNQDYHVVIPENAAEWITMIGTKALREETITLNILGNSTPEAHSAEILVTTTENAVLQTITISQEAGIDFANAVDLSTNGTANSYIVSEAGIYKFPTVKGNSAESIGSVKSVEVLWESFGTDVTPSVGDLVVRASYVNNYIAFSTPENFKEGNAVIAAKNASGTILWSWHIWLTDKPEDQTYYYSGDIMMDRNLGATSATPGDVGALGLLYEWGRKDPFLGSSNISEPIEAKSTITWPSPKSYGGSDPINYAIEKPTTFLTSNDYDEDNYDWEWSTPGSTNHSRWKSKKTIYDPCPAGYRVPDGGANGVWAKALGSYSDFTESSLYSNTNEGINFTGKLGCSSTIWYPASGFRAGYDGSLVVGGYGYYWSVTPREDDSYSLSFSDYGRINPIFSMSHAAGLPVRCQKEKSNDAAATPEVVATYLSKKGTANSYIVWETGTYKFPTVKGNSKESVGTVASVEVLWESYGTSTAPSVGNLVKSPSYANGYITFSTASTYRKGNAVIAAKNASGTILWSWHIWLTDTPKDQIYYGSAGTMMDRNLGATTASSGVGALGLLYQWGRKDPFLGSSSISQNTVAKSTATWPSTVSSSSSTGTIEYSIKCPMKFITYNTKNYDWYYTGNSSTDNTRWQSEKTIYDPCPAGYRVPDGGNTGVWYKAVGKAYYTDTSLYSSSKKGMNFAGDFGSSSTIWYPDSGYRYGYGGSVVCTGTDGRYWSVTPISDFNYTAYCLAFYNEGYVNMVFTEDRSDGYSVRCQKIE